MERSEPCGEGTTYTLLFFCLFYCRVTLKPPLFLARNVAFSCCFKDIACDECRSCILKGFLDAREERSWSFIWHWLSVKRKEKMWGSVHWYWWRPLLPTPQWSRMQMVVLPFECLPRVLKWWNFTDSHCLNWNTGLTGCRSLVVRNLSSALN